MSSINNKYTFNYSQPTEYHFSHDSVFLAQFVFEQIKNNPYHQINYMADLCSGCGVVGMDLLFHLSANQLPLPQRSDYIEVQDIYKTHFDLNAQILNKNVNKDISLEFVNKNYQDLVSDPSFKSKYDLIVCNPPYFKLGQGKLSPSEFKNRCRFYIDSDFSYLLKFIKHSLNINGQAYILLRSLIDHNLDYDLSQLSKEFNLKMNTVGDIRGTSVVLIKH